MTGCCGGCGRRLPIRALNLIVTPVVALVCGTCIGEALRTDEGDPKAAA